MAHDIDVTIFEVSPRDGLQNELAFVKTRDKIAFIDLLSNTGLKNIEVTSFVSAKSIPQLRDNLKVFSTIKKNKDIYYWVLVPNITGLNDALTVEVKNIAVFTACSETFNSRNIHCTIDESIARFAKLIAGAKEKDLNIRAYISCVLGCPYEGNIKPQQVIDVTLKLMKLGIKNFSFGDTIGVGTPKQTKALIKALLQILDKNQIAMHFHDTYGQAIANIYASLENGIRSFDSSVAGLGGCPYAQGATGNVATEDVLYLLHGLGLKTNIDIYKMIKAGEMICKVLGKQNRSKVANALLGRSDV